MMMLDQIAALLDPLDASMTECDGMTRLCHTVLFEKAIEHLVYSGSCRIEKQVIPLHFWIELQGKFEGYIVDYRLRMWLSGTATQVPHGIFRADEYRQIDYQGDVTNLHCLPEPLFQILSMSNPLRQR